MSLTSPVLTGGFFTSEPPGKTSRATKDHIFLLIKNNYLKNHDSLSQGHPLSAMGEEISLHQWVFFFPIVICQYSKIFFCKKYNICNVQQSGMQ